MRIGNIGIIVLVLMVSACAHTEKRIKEMGATSGIEATGKTTADPEYAKHLVLHNESLAGDIIITKMNTRVTGGLLEVAVELTNKTDSDMNVQYRFSWFDDSEFEVEQGSRAWTPIVLHGNGSTKMQAVAPNPRVTTYKVNVRDM